MNLLGAQRWEHYRTVFEGAGVLHFFDTIAEVELDARRRERYREGFERSNALLLWKLFISEVDDAVAVQNERTVAQTARAAAEADALAESTRAAAAEETVRTLR